MAQVAAVRKMLPPFQEKPAAELLALSRGKPFLDGNEMPSHIARRLSQQMTQAGLHCELLDRTRTGYLPVSDSGGCIIEDDSLAEAVIQRMLAAGVPVHHAEE